MHCQTCRHFNFRYLALNDKPTTNIKDNIRRFEDLNIVKLTTVKIYIQPKKCLAFFLEFY